jgi:hypothetical protein
MSAISHLTVSFAIQGVRPHEIDITQLSQTGVIPYTTLSAKDLRIPPKYCFNMNVVLGWRRNARNKHIKLL